MKQLIKRIPILGPSITQLYWNLTRPKRRPALFQNSAKYWEDRYGDGGDSGVGSYGKFAEFKAEVINGFVADKGVQSVIEFGCGDGHQLTLARYPRYLGFDVSETVIQKCRERFSADQSKSFDAVSNYRGQMADLTLSLDVIYHLVEDKVFEQYMRTLLSASTRYAIIYSSDYDQNSGSGATYIRHRQFSRWIQQNLPAWKLAEHLPNRYPRKGDYTAGSFADFFIYEKV